MNIFEQLDDLDDLEKERERNSDKEWKYLKNLMFEKFNIVGYVNGVTKEDLILTLQNQLQVELNNSIGNSRQIIFDQLGELHKIKINNNL